jgi:hypothetical protein
LSCEPGEAPLPTGAVVMFLHFDRANAGELKIGCGNLVTRTPCAVPRGVCWNVAARHPERSEAQ